MAAHRRRNPYARMVEQAVQERILDEIRAKAAQQQASVVNNVYGNHQAGGGGGGGSDPVSGRGIMDMMDPEAFDYKVHIKRDALRDDAGNIIYDPKTGKPVGWDKSVHRYRSPKGGDPLGMEPGMVGGPPGKKKAVM